MQLNGLERFALGKLIAHRPSIDEALLSAATRVLERVRTPVGFYALIELPPGLCDLDHLPECEWKFRVGLQKRGGFFVCWPVGDSRLCLEAVCDGGLDAPGLASELLSESVGPEGLREATP